MLSPRRCWVRAPAVTGQSGSAYEAKQDDWIGDSDNYLPKVARFDTGRTTAVMTYHVSGQLIVY